MIEIIREGEVHSVYVHGNAYFLRPGCLRNAKIGLGRPEISAKNLYREFQLIEGNGTDVPGPSMLAQIEACSFKFKGRVSIPLSQIEPRDEIMEFRQELRPEIKVTS